MQEVLATAFVLAGVMKSTSQKGSSSPICPGVEDFSLGTVRPIGMAELLSGLHTEHFEGPVDP